MVVPVGDAVAGVDVVCAEARVAAAAMVKIV